MWIRAALSIGLLVAGCGKKSEQAPTDKGGPAATPGAKKYSLTLDWVPEPEFGGFYAAREGGAFVRQGLEIDIRPRGQGQTWKLVAEKATDFATTAADQVLIAREQGADVVAIFAVYQTSSASHASHPHA
jgi:NitT/TauT family transport system substrate-binding protein